MSSTCSTAPGRSRSGGLAIFATATSYSRQTSGIRGSANPQMSLTISNPREMASWATSAYLVSMEKTASPDTLSMASTAVSSLSSSCSAERTSNRLFADSRPTSTMSAPSPTSSSSTYAAASPGSSYTLGSYGDSSLTFNTPMIRGGCSGPMPSP